MGKTRFPGQPPAAIFDRDDTLITDSGYMYRPEDICWIDGAKDVLRYAISRGYEVFVATNQSGIARGYHTEVDSHRNIGNVK